MVRHGSQIKRIMSHTVNEKRKNEKQKMRTTLTTTLKQIDKFSALSVFGSSFFTGLN